VAPAAKWPSGCSGAVPAAPHLAGRATHAPHQLSYPAGSAADPGRAPAMPSTPATPSGGEPGAEAAHRVDHLVNPAGGSGHPAVGQPKARLNSLWPARLMARVGLHHRRHLRRQRRLAHPLRSVTR
jgi:hypothetical protein